MPNIATWNMQGGNYTTEYKWGTVRYMMSPFGLNLEVVCLQECGRQPPSAAFGRNPQRNPNYFLYYWGTERVGLYITYYHWDEFGNRVNLAIVSKSRPTNFDLRFPSNFRPWRPAVGARINGLWYYSIHAMSPGGPDAPGLLEAIANERALAPFGHQWVAMGDFNQQPGPQFDPLRRIYCVFRLSKSETYSTKLPTYFYDYMCTNMEQQDIRGEVIGGIITSDHRPVWYVIP